MCNRIEHVNIKEVRSQAKVIGTIVTFGGALLMAMYKGPAFNLVGSHDTGSNHESSSHTSNTHWAMGTLFILIGCVAWSCFYVLQVSKLGVLKTLKRLGYDLTIIIY
jgi:drug/metabolite transporter (DMT)-like permease